MMLSARRRSAGMSLVELLVALAVAAVIMGGAVQILVGNVNNSVWEAQMAYIQENARFAVQVLGKDIRQAGYLGCHSDTITVFNAVNSTAWQYFNGAGIQGFEQGQAGFPGDLTAQWSTPASAIPGTTTQSDVLIIRRADDSADALATNHSDAAATFTLTQSSPFQPGDIFVAANARCDAIGIGQVTGPGGVTNTLQHGGSGTPGPCTPMLKADSGFNCALDPASPAGAGSPDNFKVGSALMRYSVSGYYIGESAIDSSIPALYRASVRTSAGSATATNEELVAGVEDLQLTYGVDTEDPDPDGVADRFLSAAEIAAALALDASNPFIADASSAWIGWDRVVSVRAQLTLRSLDEIRDAITAQPFPDAIVTNVTYNDRFVRQLVTATFQIRNGARG